MTEKSSKQKAAPPKPARAVSKQSPLKGMDVGEWVRRKTSGWQRTVVERMLAVAQEAAPKATFTIKWAQPVLEQDGPVAYIKPAKAHVTFGFWRGAELSDAKGILEGGNRMKHLKVPATEGLDEPSLRAFVRQAIKLNVAKGDPTKRR